MNLKKEKETRGDNAHAHTPLLVHVCLGTPAPASPSMSVSKLRGDDAHARTPACAHVFQRSCFDLVLHVRLPKSRGSI